MKKVYFACSISGGRDHAHVYEDIVQLLKDCGLDVLSEMFAKKSLKAHIGPTPNFTPRQTWTRDISMLKEADLIIAEVTQPSLGVGYQIGTVEGLNKPILVLFFKGSGRRLSPMIAGNPKVTVIEYNDVEDIRQPLKKWLQQKLN